MNRRENSREVSHQYPWLVSGVFFHLLNTYANHWVETAGQGRQSVEPPQPRHHGWVYTRYGLVFQVVLLRRLCLQAEMFRSLKGLIINFTKFNPRLVLKKEACKQSLKNWLCPFERNKIFMNSTFLGTAHHYFENLHNLALIVTI